MTKTIIDFPKNISITEAQEIISNNSIEPSFETIELSASLDRILAEDLYAPEALPRYDNSAMDGYAINWEPENKKYKIVGESHAGYPFEGICQEQEAVRISTGAQIPQGTDTVVPIENIIELANGDIELVIEPKKKGQHLRYKGEEIEKGELLLRKMSKINPANIALLASLGLSSFKVYAKAKLAIILSGSELADYNDINIKTWQIRESNGLMLSSLITKANATLSFSTKVEDNLEATKDQLNEALNKAEIILFSGGISVGSKDFVMRAAQELGFEILFWKIKQKPGKPMMFAQKKIGTQTKLLFALPGNPVSSLFCFSYYCYPMISKLQGQNDSLQKEYGILKENFTNNSGNINFVRASIDRNNRCIVIDQKQGSHMLSACIKDGGFIQVNPGEELKAGERVELILFPWI